MQKYLRLYLPLLAALTAFLWTFFFATAAGAVVFNVGNNSALTTALGSVNPGDSIVMSNGNYSGFTVTRSGTAANPITILAQNPGLATNNTGIVKFSAVSYVILSGLTLTTPGGSVAVDGTSDDMELGLIGATNCRITRCTFAPPTNSLPANTFFTYLNGTCLSNRIDHCEYGWYTNSGCHAVRTSGTVAIAGVTAPSDRMPWALGYGPYNPNMARYTWIDHNYFHDHYTPGANGGETIQLGAIGDTGDYQNLYTLVEYNLFVNCDGDPEIISVKGSSNTLRYNTVTNSAAVFSLRAGNNDSVYGNFFLCGGAGGGIKMCERDHKIFNNYIENSDNSNYPLMLESGNLYNVAFSHAQVVRAQIVHNTVVNPGRQVLFAHSGNLPVVDPVFANNIITGSGTLYSEDVASLNPVRSQNIIFGYTPSQSGFLVENPQLMGNSPQRLSASSPAINNGNTNYYPYVTDDMDGQPRNIPRDIGADEYYVSAFIARAPLTTNVVGPNSVDMELSATPLSQSVNIGATNVSYTINVTSDISVTSTVTLTVNGLMPGMSAGFNPPTVNGSGTVTLNITNTSAVLGGSYSFIVTATSSNLASSVTVNLQAGRTPSNLRWTATGSSVWDIQNSSNWFNLSSNTADAFYNGDTVLLDDTAGVQTNLTIAANVAVSPSIITNNSSTNNFTISGAGKITGATMFVKTGSSTLTLDTTNEFGGGMTVVGGTLIAGNPYALGGQGGFIIVTNGATLDVNGNNLGMDAVLTSGAGVGGNGVIVNNGADVFPALAVIELAADTTIGGAHRWDLRGAYGNQTASLSTSGNGFNLTKGGTNFISIANVTVDPGMGNINVQSGTLSIEGNTTGLGNPSSTLTVFSNATLYLTNTVWATNQTLSKVFVLNDGAIVQNGSGANILLGTLALNGNDTFNIGGTSLTFSNRFSGSGNLIKTGSGALNLNGTNTYTGNTIVSNGTLNVTPSGVISKSPQITIGSGATFSVSGTVTTGSGGIVSGSAGSTLMVSGGTLNATNTVIGTLASPIGIFTLNNATVQFTVASGITNASVSTLSLGSLGNMINIAALPANFPAQYPLIQYRTLSGVFNFTLGALPGGYVGYLSNNTANASVDLVVNGPSTFSISAMPPSQTAASGGATVNYTMTVSTNSGFSGSVALSVGGLPTNTGFSFIPSSLSGAGSSTLSITTSNNTPVGAYPLTIAGVNNNVTNSASVTLIVGRVGGANLEWNSTSSTVWDVTNSYNWFNLGSGVSDQFYNGDSVLFDDTAAVTEITIGTGVVVLPSVVTNISSANNFTISGSGKISGTNSIVKDGTSTLTLSTTNDFTGSVTVLNGILKVGCTNALGTIAGSTFVTNGGTLDINGVNLGMEPIIVSGDGLTNGGAIINSGGQQTVALKNLTLAGDTAFGGTGRWDIRNTGGTASLSTGNQSWSITKVGTNQVSLVGVNPIDAKLADIDIQQGTFAIQTSTTQVGDPTRTITVYGGATLDLYTLSTPLNKNIVLQDGGTIFDEKGPSYVTGPIALSGNSIFNAAFNGTPPNLVCSNVISGAGNFVKTNGGTLLLTGTNTYTGSTLVINGTLALVANGSISNSVIINVASGATLDASGRSDGTLSLANGQTLTGNGTLNGSVVVSNGTLSPGTNSIGTLTFNNNLTLKGGSTTAMALNKTLLTNVVAQVAGTLTYGGTLALTNLSGTPASGDSFKLFNAAIYTGAFTNLTPAIPAVNLAWNTNGLTNGILSIVSAPTPRPQIGGVMMNGNSFIFNGTNGVPNWTYYVLASTNVALPLTNWTMLSTDNFDAAGNFTFTNVTDPNAPQSFYLLQLQ
jgi:poly(beta-D-mannuronate) lyase